MSVRHDVRDNLSMRSILGVVAVVGIGAFVGSAFARGDGAVDRAVATSAPASRSTGPAATTSSVWH